MENGVHCNRRLEELAWRCPSELTEQLQDAPPEHGREDSEDNQQQHQTEAQKLPVVQPDQCIRCGVMGRATVRWFGVGFKSKKHFLLHKLCYPCITEVKRAASTTPEYDVIDDDESEANLREQQRIVCRKWCIDYTPFEKIPYSDMCFTLHSATDSRREVEARKRKRQSFDRTLFPDTTDSNKHTRSKKVHKPDKSYPRAGARHATANNAANASANAHTASVHAAVAAAANKDRRLAPPAYLTSRAVDTQNNENNNNDNDEKDNDENNTNNHAVDSTPTDQNEHNTNANTFLPDPTTNATTTAIANTPSPSIHPMPAPHSPEQALFCIAQAGDSERYTEMKERALEAIELLQQYSTTLSKSSVNLMQTFVNNCNTVESMKDCLSAVSRTVEEHEEEIMQQQMERVRSTARSSFARIRAAVAHLAVTSRSGKDTDKSVSVLTTELAALTKGQVHELCQDAWKYVDNAYSGHGPSQLRKISAGGL